MLHGISDMIMMSRQGYCLHSTYLVCSKSVLDVGLNWSNDST